jgi:tyrosine-protein kinase Etk/Wzc
VERARDALARGNVEMIQEQPKHAASFDAELSVARDLPVRGVPSVRVPMSDEATLAGYAWTVVKGWRTVVAALAAALAMGVLYLLVATPVYHSDTIVQVEPRNSGLAGLEELITQGPQGPAETEMALIRSRSSLNAVIEELGLDVNVAPRRFPLIGGSLARRYEGAGPAPAFLGLDSWAWGGESLAIQRLDVPDDLLDVPLRLTAGEGGHYRLDVEDTGALLVEGAVGAEAVAGEGARTAVAVSRLVARPGTQFTVTKRRRSDLAAALQKQLRIAEDGRLSGVLVISLAGASPARTAAILDAVADHYVRQNVERKSAEAAQQLAFIESQLPLVKANVSTAEAALNKFLKTHGSVNLSTEAQSILDRAAAIERELSALEMQGSELRQRFTAKHPTVASLNEKMQVLRAERGSINARMQQMPEREADTARLQRDLKVATDLYTLLFNKAQELRVVKMGTVGNVRIVDRAVVANRPSWPKRGTVLALTTLLGLLGGVGLAIVRKALAQGADDAEEIEAGTGLPVYATVVHSRAENDLARLRRTGQAASGRILAAVDPQDPAIESIRSLRTSVQFALVESRRNVILISGPAPGVGKTFVCVNLAYVLASTDARVLIIDADLRRGRLHHKFGVARRPGVSDVLCDAEPLASAIRPTGIPSVDILPTGSVPPNPVELLSSDRFSLLVDKVSRAYAYVLVDTPPALAVTDATVVARLAGVNLLVLRAGQHSMREIAICVKRFTQSGSTVHGAILNDVQPTLGRYGRHGRYQRYDYRSEDA